MADGNMSDLDDADRDHMRAIGLQASSGFTAGQHISILTNDDTFDVKVGRQYFDERDARTFTVTGAMHPEKWCDQRGISIGCAPRDADGYAQARIKYEDGSSGLICGDNIGYFLSGAEEIQYLDKPTLEILDYDQMCNLPDPVWMVDGLLQEQTSALIFGKSNAYKSFLGVDIACSVATGTAWHGHHVGRPRRALYVATALQQDTLLQLNLPDDYESERIVSKLVDT